MTAHTQSDTATGNDFLFFYLYFVGGTGFYRSTNTLIVYFLKLAFKVGILVGSIYPKCFCF